MTYPYAPPAPKPYPGWVRVILFFGLNVVGWSAVIFLFLVVAAGLGTLGKNTTNNYIDHTGDAPAEYPS